MKKRKKLLSILLATAMVSVTTACSFTEENVEETTEESVLTDSTQSSDYSETLQSDSEYFDDSDLNESYDNTDAVITLNGNKAEIDGAGVTFNDNILSITSGGTYVISGSLENGQIYVNNDDETHIVLNGVKILSDTSSPFYVENTDKVIITAVTGTENILSDASEYVYENTDENEPDAVIFSKDDLSINGNGKLVINGNFNEGITCKNDLRIANTNITVTSVGNAIKGKDTVVVKESDLTIDAGKDGIKTTNSDEDNKGFIVIESGNINITSKEDAVQAEKTLTINNGNVNIKTGSEENVSEKAQDIKGFGGMMEGNQNKTEQSEKGLKSSTEIIINDGVFNIDSTDDSIHSNGDITINGGNYVLNSGDDAIHSDATINVNDGNISVESSYEGIEALEINVNGGNISIYAEDDGFNASDGTGSDFMNFGGFDEGSSSISLNINEGVIYVNAQGDGLDSNGIININGGITTIDGPVNDGNGALDSGSEILVNGGILVAAGSSGMAEIPSEDSKQNSLAVTFSQANSANTPIILADSNGKAIMSYTPTKEYSSVVISSPEIKTGEEYNVYYGGSCSGNSENGLIINGDYSESELLETITISQSVSQIGTGTIGGTMNNMFGGGHGGEQPDGDFNGGAGGIPDNMPDNMPEMGGDMQPPDGNFNFNAPFSEQ